MSLDYAKSIVHEILIVWVIAFDEEVCWPAWVTRC